MNERHCRCKLCLPDHPRLYVFIYLYSQPFELLLDLNVCNLEFGRLVRRRASYIRRLLYIIRERAHLSLQFRGISCHPMLKPHLLELLRQPFFGFLRPRVEVKLIARQNARLEG